MADHLFIITNAISRSELTSTYNAAWSRFLTRPENAIPNCDIKFLVIGDDKVHRRYLNASAFPVIWNKSLGGPGELDGRRSVLKVYREAIDLGYKTVTYFHADTFPFQGSLNNIYKHLEENPDTNMILPINRYGLLSIGIKDQIPNWYDINYHFFRMTNDNTFPLWGIPYPGSGMLTLSTDLISKVLSYLGNDSDALNTFTWRINRMSAELGYTGPYHDNQDEVYAVGPFRMNFFTALAKQKPKVAILTNTDNRSFTTINGRVLGYTEEIIKFNSIKECVDEVDINPSCIERKIVAPFFHLGDSIHGERIIDPIAFRDNIHERSYYDYIVGKFFSYESILYYTILRILTYSYEEAGFIDSLNRGITFLMKEYEKIKGIDKEKLYEAELKMLDICKDTFTQYSKKGVFDVLKSNTISKML